MGSPYGHDREGRRFEGRGSLVADVGSAVDPPRSGLPGPRTLDRSRYVGIEKAMEQNLRLDTTDSEFGGDDGSMGQSATHFSPSSGRKPGVTPAKPRMRRELTPSCTSTEPGSPVPTGAQPIPTRPGLARVQSSFTSYSSRSPASRTTSVTSLVSASAQPRCSSLPANSTGLQIV